MNTIDERMQRVMDSFVSDIAQMIRVAAFEAVENTLDEMKAVSQPRLESPTTTTPRSSTRPKRTSVPPTKRDTREASETPLPVSTNCPAPTRREPPDAVRRMTQRLAGALYGKPGTARMLREIAAALGVTSEALAPAVAKLLVAGRVTKMGDGPGAVLTAIVMGRSKKKRGPSAYERATVLALAQTSSVEMPTQSSRN